jgi:hypothetical protein
MVEKTLLLFLLLHQAAAEALQRQQWVVRCVPRMQLLQL